jgi:hypothetical protein
VARLPPRLPRFAFRVSALNSQLPEVLRSLCSASGAGSTSDSRRRLRRRYGHGKNGAWMLKTAAMSVQKTAAQNSPKIIPKNNGRARA